MQYSGEWLMVMLQWYELRIAGSAGTSTGAASGTGEAIAISESGRLCSGSSGQAKKFESRQAALDFLGRTTLPGIYNFEPVLCPPAPDQTPRHNGNTPS
ncbi:MAG TPA: hypothetical protein VLT92_09580 [Burkholderiales bacterium]|nr:hypothetical protein [Burkholderiales bacterium]